MDKNSVSGARLDKANPKCSSAKRYPGAVAVWERAWERSTPFLAFPPEARKIIYTTHAIWVF